MSPFLLFYQMLKLIGNKLHESDTRLTKDIKKHIREDLDRRYDGIPDRVAEILNAATFLDPRFKTNYIKDSDLESTKQMLVDESADISLAGLMITVGHRTKSEQFSC